jgi:hypothetical protein
MKTRVLLLLALPLVIAQPARAEPITLDEVRARTDETQRQVHLARERLAVMSKALMTPALQTTIHVSDETGAAFKVFERRPQLRFSDGNRGK